VPRGTVVDVPEQRYHDPTTSRIIRVWIDPADGIEHYVAE
jgi:hypothetical protein